MSEEVINREKIISKTSILGIVVNLLIALGKVIIGIITASIAIISEGVNNAADAFSSLLTLVGTKLAGKHPNSKHPFGYGRIEYLVGLIISVIILISGFETIKSAIELIFNPSDSYDVSVIALVIVGVSMIIKFFLGKYTVKMGKKAGSEGLVGVGVECQQDCLVSFVTIISALVFIIWKFNIDAYAGIVTSFFILKAGFEVLKETLSEIIGRKGDRELAIRIYRRIVSTPGILNAADMMLHNYGPDRWSGSVNIEIEHDQTVGEVYDFIHKLQLDIMHEEHVTMVFGIYAVDQHTPNIKEMRKCISEFIVKESEVKSFHALYLEPNTNNLYVDLIVTYKQKDWENLEAKFKKYLNAFYPDYNIILTIETEFV